MLEFFSQVIEYTNEFRDTPLFMLWVGPIPFLFLYRSETIEVHTHGRYEPHTSNLSLFHVCHVSRLLRLKKHSALFYRHLKCSCFKHITYSATHMYTLSINFNPPQKKNQTNKNIRCATLLQVSEGKEEI